MKKFAQYVIQYRLAIIISTVLITLFLGYQLKDAKVNSDVLTYLKPDDPAVILFNRIGEKYSGTDLILVGIGANNIFEHKTLQTINQLTERIKSVNSVVSVMSLTDILDIRSVDGGLEIGKLIDKNNIPSDPEELKHIRKYVLANDMFNGRIISPDGKITLIIARLKQQADKETIAKEIQNITRNIATDYQIYFSGMPMQMLEISKIVETDMTRLIPIVIIMLILTLYFSFRSKRGVLLPLSTVLISTIWAMGLMTLMGIDLSIISNGMPVILIAIGSAFGIHLIARYNEETLNSSDKETCIKNALAKIGIPIILAGVTTIIGFFAFAGSYLTIVTYFGIFTGIGVAFALFVSITFIPALLFYFKEPKMKQIAKGKDNNMFVRFVDRLSNFVLRRSKLIVYGAGIIIILAVIGIPNLHREVNLTEYFKKDTDIRLAEEMMEKNFGGSTPIQIVVDGDIKNPFVLKEMRKLEKFMKTIPNVNHPQSVADLICEMNKVTNHHYTIPDTREGVANLWFFIDGKSVMEQLVNAENSEAIIQANLGTVKTQEAAKIVNIINDYVNNQLDKNLLAVQNIDVNQPDIQNYLSDEIATSILLDIRNRDKDIVVNKKKLKNKILAIYKIKTVRFDDNDIEQIGTNIDDFFLDESEIIINNKMRIALIRLDIIKQLKDGFLPSQKQLIRTIERILPYLSAEDREMLPETAHSLHVILNEAYQYKKIIAAVKQLMPLFPQKLQSDVKFRDELRDDLWVLNDNNLALPLALVKKNSIKGEKIELKVKQTGMPLIFTKLDESIVKSQIQSLIIAFVLVTLILMLQLKSISGGIIAVSPIALTVLLNFALMSYLNIPLDMATIMIGSIAIGIGIDYSIHFASRFKEEFVKDNSKLEVLKKTLNTTGRAILINASTVAMGFIVLILGELVPMQRFGWLTAATMLFSAFSTITFLPAIIIVSKAKFVGGYNRDEAMNKISTNKNKVKLAVNNFKQKNGLKEK